MDMRANMLLSRRRSPDEAKNTLTAQGRRSAGGGGEWAGGGQRALHARRRLRSKAIATLVGQPAQAVHGSGGIAAGGGGERRSKGGGAGRQPSEAHPFMISHVPTLRVAAARCPIDAQVGLLTAVGALTHVGAAAACLLQGGAADSWRRVRRSRRVQRDYAGCEMLTLIAEGWARGVYPTQRPRWGHPGRLATQSVCFCTCLDGPCCSHTHK